MRKIVIMLLCLILVGCDEKTVYVDMLTYDIDMSGYIAMKDIKDDHFVGIMPEEMLEAKDEGGSGIFYMGNIDCVRCQNIVGILEEVATDMDMTINYINTANDISPVKEELISTFYDHLPEDEKGEKEIRLPLVTCIKNGKVLDTLIGEKDYDTYRALFELLV